MAVDFSLHLSHSFVHARGDRAARVVEMLHVMGVSVTSGMMTTFLSCCVLYACNLLWFQRFGMFVTMLISMSFATSIVGLTAALAFIGPNEGVGDVALPWSARHGPIEPIAK